MKYTLLCLAVCVAYDTGETRSYVVCNSLRCAYVAGETCSGTDYSQCQFEHCTGDGWTLSCHSGKCTCDHPGETGAACTSLADCTGSCKGAGALSNFLKMHCFDGLCNCQIGGVGR